MSSIVSPVKSVSGDSSSPNVTLYKVVYHRKSNFSVENPQNPENELFIQSIRSDVLHYDNEKYQRISYSLNLYEELNAGDSNVKETLKKISNIIEHFQKTRTVLTGTENMPQSVESSSVDSLTANQKLFNAINPLLTQLEKL